jgi:hypothetical protein
VRFLLRLYPRRWRERYGDEVEALLDETPEEPLRTVDLARGAVDAHRRQGVGHILAAAAVLLASDVAIGWLNYHASDDVQLVALALIVAAFGFAAWRPRWAWLFVLLLWFAVPLSSIVGYANNYHPGLVKPAPLYETLVALIPTALGALFGAGARRMARLG